MIKSTHVEESILNNIQDLIQIMPMQILLMDNKKVIEEILGTSHNSFKSIMKFFSESEENFGYEKDYFGKGKHKYYKDLENRPITKSIFNILGWENEWIDIINSFWGNYTYSLVEYSKRENTPTFKDIAVKMKNIGLAQNIASWKCELFGLDKNGFFQIVIRNELKTISKNKYATKVLEDDNIQSIIVEKYFLSDKKKREKIFLFSSLCHSVANFMPGPNAYEKGKLSYNQLKGTLSDVKDYLPLMINKIQKCIKEEQNLKYGNGPNDHICLDTLISWKNWFSSNREKFYLEDYFYIIKNDEGCEELIGIPLFKRQSLEVPVPENETEVNECLNNILRIIQTRAFKMSEQLKNNVK